MTLQEEFLAVIDCDIATKIYEDICFLDEVLSNANTKGKLDGQALFEAMLFCRSLRDLALVVKNNKTYRMKRYNLENKRVCGETNDK